MTETSLPYAGTSGHSGTDTSAERAEEADSSGKTAKRQTTVLNALAAAGPRGLTVHELDRLTGWNHHGTTSGALSVLHKDDRIARLTERRDRCRVYVAHEYLDGREHDAHGRGAGRKVEDPLHALVAEWLAVGDDGWSRAGRYPREFAAALRRHLAMTL